MQKIAFIIITFFFASLSRAQENFTGNFEPFIELGYDINDFYSHEFSIEGRVNWYDDKDYKFQGKQIDLAHFSSFKLNDKNEVALGIQYRFEENFGGNDKNELRITEEYKYEIERKNTEFENRLRVEQRFAESSTSHRFRYKFGITHALGPKEEEKNGIDLMGNLETLVSISKSSKPEYEQRIAAGIGWPLNDFAEMELGTEYRLDDFTGDLGHELFIFTGISLNL